MQLDTWCRTVCLVVRQGNPEKPLWAALTQLLCTPIHPHIQCYVGKLCQERFTAAKDVQGTATVCIYTSWLLWHTRNTCNCIWFRLPIALVAFTHYIGCTYTLHWLRLCIMFVTFMCYVSCFYMLCLLCLHIILVAFTHYACCVYTSCLLHLHWTNAESNCITFTFPLTCTVQTSVPSRPRQVCRLDSGGVLGILESET